MHLCQCMLRVVHQRTHVLAQDCNLVLYKSGTSSPSTALFQSNTYMGGAEPCHLLVSSASGGTISVIDNTGKVLFIK